ncbi:MAG: methyltransferase, partial [Methanobacteriota archaeon]
MTDFPVREVREGQASFFVPDVPVLGGPGRRSTLPFYNPAMTVNRDVTLSVLSTILPPNATVLDGLAGTGVFGARAALETERSPRVTWNDKNPNARDLILRNAARNDLEGEVLTDDLRALLARRRFDYVDIDPFGPATPFMDGAIQQARNGGVLGINGTDVSPLAGTHPRACWRRYGARSVRNPCGRETALRIFFGFLVRLAAMHERGIRPLAAFAAEHFVKAIAAVDSHTSAADNGLAQLGFVRFVGARHEISSTPPNGPHAGPLWLGPLADPALLAAMSSRAETGYD